MKNKGFEKLVYLILSIGIGAVYFYYQSESIYGGDSGDLAATVATIGIPHPPGYPLYTLVGVLLTKIIPFGTLAWKLGFLSSIPSIIGAIIFFDLLYYLTKKLWPSVISVFILFLLYPIWLYSEVVEVFALNNMFMIVLLWLLFHWQKTQKKKYLYISVLIFGLSLCHHHIILFLVPSLFILFWGNRKEINGKDISILVGLFIAGILPYVYPLITAFSQPALNWMGEPTLKNFIDLVTRAGYGTFRANQATQHIPILRLTSVWSYFDFVYKDFRILGIILFLLGIVNLVRNKEHRIELVVILTGIASYLFFLFYASFPLTGDFIVATFERFVQPLYILFTFLLVYGLIFFESLINNLFICRLENNKRKIVSNLVIVMFIIYPVGLFVLNFPKISILKKDFTAENLGRDILNTVPENSIIIIGNDTPLFNTQYVYYSEEKWPNIKLIHYSKLFTPYYANQLKEQYPDLVIPDKKIENQDQFINFLSQNYPKFPIYIKFSLRINTGDFIPYGLLFRYYEKDKIPPNEEVIKENERLWFTYHNPLSGSLSKYKNLMLSDVLGVYSVARQETAYFEAKHGFSKEAERHVIEAKKLNPKDFDPYIIMAQIFFQQKKCDQAQHELEYIQAKDPQNTESLLLMAVNYRDCFGDKEKGEIYDKKYQEMKRAAETPLTKL